MIVIIDNYDSFTFNLYQMVATMVDEVKVIKNDELTVEELSEVHPDAIILSPGPGHPDRAGICQEVVRYFSGRVPILGVCLGHQAIVSALGGKVVCANKVAHGKASLIFHNGQGIFEGLPIPFQAARYHSLVADIQQLPEEFSVIAESADGNVMAVKHKDYPTYGLQFHPESIMTPCGGEIIRRFVASFSQRRSIDDAHCA
jgi:anthranilate synthase/aminodeoxychorismate synthase-like glutamine amidotransferase